MATTEKYTTVIELNSEQAKRNLDELRRKVESWKSDLAEAREKKMGKSFIAAIRKELTAAEKELKKYDSEVMRTIDTMNNLNSASVERIEEAQKSLIRLSKEVPHDSPFYEQLNGMLDQVTQELENIKATKAFEQLQQEAAGAIKSTAQLDAELAFIKQTAENAGTASVKQLQLAERTAQDIKNSAKEGSREWNEASAGLETVRARLTAIEEEEKKVVTIIDRYNNELKQAGKESLQVAKDTELIDRTLSKLSSASVRDIEYSIRILNEQLRDTERTGGNVEDITNKLKQLNEELKKVQDMQKPDKEKEGFFSRIITGLNKNWGAITQIIGAITGLSMTIRKSVDEYAKMEEEMADVRKYTGLADAAVRDLNEDLKKMDTRTAREQLNQLAGSAGRLGKDSKKDILEFVEAGDMINIALGDDLGDGAIEKVGKLAMAFGEDKKKGLKGAMLSTGSAINELVQNSSAMGGFLVDFTARVAGFGKQIGLTQAQIMGYGTVMDENLLRDEMAATAFGNMLTKMQTDTEKFSRIAGMDMKAFTKLLNEDANAAILALADNLKKADPQNMMKMLDDMGLDGSRAVAVLATLADKIDDVRKHQERANKAYQEGTSVIKEYEIKNNTVQAGIEKCKKQFQEIVIVLGEKLLPIVKYTISSSSLIIKTLLAIVSVMHEYYSTIVSTSAALAGLIAYRQRDIIATKLQVLWNDRLVKGVKMLWGALAKNPYTALFAVLAVGVGLLSDLIRRHQEATKETKKLTDAQREQKAMADTMKAVDDEVNRSTAEKITRFKQLRKTLEDGNREYKERKEALDEIKKITPDYHGTLTTENKLINSNATALDNYVSNLMSAARAQAAFNKMVELQGSSMEHESTLQQRQANMAWARQRLQQAGASENTSFRSNMGGGYQMYDDSGQYVKTVTAAEKERIEGYQRVIEYNNKRIAQEQQILETNKKQTDQLQKMVSENGGVKSGDSNSTAGNYVSDTERKKLEEQRHKREIEERKRRKEAEDAAKAESDAMIALKTHEYAMGEMTYRQYIKEMAKLQLEGLQNRRDVYEKGSAEYEKLNRQVEELSFKGDQQVNQMKLEDLQRLKIKQQTFVEAQAAREVITEQEKLERLRVIDEMFLMDKVALYKKGSRERMNAEWELQDVEQRNKMERERQYQQQLEQVREQYLGMSNTRQMEIAMKGLDDLHSKGLLKEKEYRAALVALQAQYASYQTTSERNQQVGSEMLKVAGDAAKRELDNKGGADTPFLGTIQQYQTTMEKLKQLYGNDKANHDAYLAAKQQATAQFCESLASQMQAAYNSINQVMSAAGSYFSAQQDYETSMVRKKYEKQIEAAGNNQKKVKKLQEKQAKEEAAIKTKYNNRQVKIQIAQALAQTAQNAISAYGAALQIGPSGLVLAPIMAAMAVAAGMLQVATIKKQAEAQQAGYYEGGFTGGKRYRKEAGVVHEGEFVANHQAVNNPNILPFLNFLDQAQRNNTVGSLTAQDVSRSMGAAGTTQMITPIVNVQNDNPELLDTLERVNENQDRLATQLELGIGVDFPIDGDNGLYRRLKRYEKLISKK